MHYCVVMNLSDSPTEDTRWAIVGICDRLKLIDISYHAMTLDGIKSTLVDHAFGILGTNSEIHSCPLQRFLTGNAC
jgi:hypothetical protein